MWVKLICAYIIWLVLPVAIEWDKQIGFGYRHKEPFWQVLSVIVCLAMILTMIVLRIISIICGKIVLGIDTICTRYGKYISPDKK